MSSLAQSGAVARRGLLTLALLAAAASSSCNRNKAPANTLVTGIRDDMRTWDPADAYDSISLDIVPHVIESLYQYSYLRETLTLEPLLADGMPRISKDRRTVTLKIKPGVRFQDDPCFKDSQGKGRTLTARDFEYAWKRLALPSLNPQGLWVFDEKLTGFHEFHERLVAATTPEARAAEFEKGITGLRIVDDLTLELKLVAPYPQLGHVLAMTFTAPFPREAVLAYGDEKGAVTEHPVGTGPYVLKEWRRNRHVVLERNPNFRPELYPLEADATYRAQSFHVDRGKPLPFLDRLEFEVMREQQPEWLSFLKGRLDRVKIPKDRFQQVITQKVNLVPELRAKGVRLEIDSGLLFYYVTFNMRDPLIGKNKALRQALSSAIDRERWIETFTNGTGRKMNHALPYGIADRPAQSALKYDFDLTRARKLLGQAGYPDGKGLPELVFDLRGADSMARQLGDFFQQSWEKLGIKVRVELNTFPAWLEKQKRGNFQVGYGGWELDYPDPQNAFQILYGKNQAPGPNEANFDHPEFNRLYEQMERLEAGPARARLIAQMDAIAQEECPWAYGYFHLTYHLAHPWVFNYRASDGIHNKLKYVRIAPDIRKRYLEGK